MTPSSSLGAWVVCWTVTAAIILLSRMRSGVVGAGLVPAFVLNLAMGYWLAAAVDLLPWQPHYDRDIVATGFRVSTYGLIAFGLGSVVLAPRFARGALPVRGPVRVPPARVAVAYILVGLVSLVVLLPIAGRLPTAGALVSQAWNLLIVGLGLACWRAWHRGQPIDFAKWLTATLCLPLLTVLTQGFLGYGTTVSIAVLALIASFYRPRWQVLAASLALGYVALSLYVTYMRDREAIRDSVWGGDPVAARVQRVYASMTTLEWFDLSNQDHLLRVDNRLNQNFVVGSAVEYLDAGLAQFAYGRNLWDGVLSLIPRAIWPSKPFVAGSGNVVAQYTGLVFSPGTAVGVGSLLEAYISFGTTGVVVGFVLLGLVVGVIDAIAGRRLRAGDWPGFARWFVPCLALLQVQGSIVELTSSLGAALVVTVLANRLVAGLAGPDERRAGQAGGSALSRFQRRTGLHGSAEVGRV